MTIRERILSVYRGEVPDVVPFMLDISHWFLHKFDLPWDLSQPCDEPQYDLISYHRKVGAGFYIANNASFYQARYGNDVRLETTKRVRNGDPEISWCINTPLGTIQRRRVWEPCSYSWAIRDWGVSGKRDLQVLAYALGSRRFVPRWDRYQAWAEEVGDCGVVYISAGYSAMGYLLSLWMGVESTVYACADWPELMREVVDTINENNLRLINLLAGSPAEIVVMGDNFSSDIQLPGFFNRWSRHECPLSAPAQDP